MADERPQERWRRRNWEKFKTYQREWHRRNPHKAREYYERSGRRKRRHRAWRQKYGLTPAERDELFEQSDGLCAVCYQEPATQIDHDHRTGQVRGALCWHCNAGMGHFFDDPERLELALEYLGGR